MKKSLYRVDKFSVPPAAREEFLSRVRATHEVLRCQPGFLRDAVLEQSSGPGEFNFVTIVEWENAEALEPARQAVATLHQRMKFDARAMIARLGIRSDIANYEQVEWSGDTAERASVN